MREEEKETRRERRGIFDNLTLLRGRLQRDSLPMGLQLETNSLMAPNASECNSNKLTTATNQIDRMKFSRQRNESVKKKVSTVACCPFTHVTLAGRQGRVLPRLPRLPPHKRSPGRPPTLRSKSN